MEFRYPSTRATLRTLRDVMVRRPRPAVAFVDEPPLRSELFSREQLAQHGKVLAASHRLSARRVPDRLLARLADNEYSGRGRGHS